jgi:S-adenosylmethionine:tRNA ribosyltransferase-isomerase
MRTEELDYDLDPSLIATHPADPRDSARMLVVHRESDRIEHRFMRELPEFLVPGDSIVLNTTRVMPARVAFHREGTGAVFEGLLMGDGRVGELSAFVRGAKRLHEGDRLSLHDRKGASVGTFEVLPRQDERVPMRAVDGTDVIKALEAVGRAPLPPYILGARRDQGEEDSEQLDRCDLAWYQTVYARAGASASVAAPTAGLHFTPGLLEEVQQARVQRIDVELEVGAGTFRPVSAPTLEEHAMHSERFSVSAVALEAIAATHARGGRIVSVGTTSCRTLESLAEPLPSGPISSETSLLITPGHRFRHVGALLTNFHLPRSTLLALVAAFMGLERTLSVYDEAIRERYRFYSYGDAMLIV